MLHRKCLHLTFQARKIFSWQKSSLASSCLFLWCSINHLHLFILKPSYVDLLSILLLRVFTICDSFIWCLTQSNLLVQFTSSFISDKNTLFLDCKKITVYSRKYLSGTLLSFIAAHWLNFASPHIIILIFDIDSGVDVSYLGSLVLFVRLISSIKLI